VTEAEWMACADPEPMLKSLTDRRSDRKLRLFAVACCRRITHLLSRPEFIRTIEIAELFADKEATANECEIASLSVYDFCQSVAPAERNNIDLAVVWASMVNWTEGYQTTWANYASGNACRLGSPWIIGRALSEGAQREQKMHSAFLRDIFPYSSVTLDQSWLTSTVIALAQQMYDSRDFAAMPILADALQDAGCDNTDILNHCRAPGPHVRGCWCVDKLLLKE
jgi:hypothetical protein